MTSPTRTIPTIHERLRVLRFRHKDVVRAIEALEELDRLRASRPHQCAELRRVMRSAGASIRCLPDRRIA